MGGPKICPESPKGCVTRHTRKFERSTNCSSNPKFCVAYESELKNVLTSRNTDLKANAAKLNLTLEVRRPGRHDRAEPISELGTEF